MGHFSVTVLVSAHKVDKSDRDAVYDAAEELLEPYDQNIEIEPYEEECDCLDEGLERVANPECEECHGTGKFTTTSNSEGKWDWWKIGGRFTGLWVTDYDPETDPLNMEPCPFCTGPKARNSQAECASCEGAGYALKWPTQWREFDRDILPVSQVRTDAVTYALLTPAGRWYETKHFHVAAGCGPEWKQQYCELMAVHVNCLAVVVDCHE